MIPEANNPNFDQLAIFGGSPSFAQPLHVGRPAVGNTDRVLARLRTSMENRWLTNNGPLVQEFERRVCEFLNVEHCIAVCNGTMGLMLAIRALNMTGNVIVPSFTFSATPQSLLWQGLTPIFCDVDPHTHCLSADLVAKVMDRQNITGIIGVHLWGLPCDVEELSAVASQFEVPLLMDAAHAFGSKFKGQHVGGFGDAEVFSFHATKIVSAFEGGAVTTNDAALAKRIRTMRNFGFDNMNDVVGDGINGKMSEASAAMGLTSLEAIDTSLANNRLCLEHYQKRLQTINGLKLVDGLDSADSNCHYCVIDVEDQAGLTRDEWVAILRAENVLAKKYFSPGCHRTPMFSKFDSPEKLEVTEELCTRLMQLPTGVSVTTDAVDRLCDLLEFCAANSLAIRERLRGMECVERVE